MGARRLNTDDTHGWHLDQREWLEREIAQAKVCLLLSFLSSFRCLSSSFRCLSSSFLFLLSLSVFVFKIDSINRRRVRRWLSLHTTLLCMDSAILQWTT